MLRHRPASDTSRIQSKSRHSAPPPLLPVARDRCLRSERSGGWPGGWRRGEARLGGGRVSPQPGSLGPNRGSGTRHSGENRAPLCRTLCLWAAGVLPRDPLIGRPWCETLIPNLPQPHSPTAPCPWHTGPWRSRLPPLRPPLQRPWACGAGEGARSRVEKAGLTRTLHGGAIRGKRPEAAVEGRRVGGNSVIRLQGQQASGWTSRPVLRVQLIHRTC